MDEHATALADAIDEVLPAWVERCVRRIATAWGQAPVDRDVIAAAAAAAAADVGPRVRALLAADVDEQRTTPLALLRGAVRYPTEVLRDAGVPPVERDPYDEDAFPDDVYGLTPATWTDVDERLGPLGLAWGAAKAWEHKRRHGGGS